MVVKETYTHGWVWLSWQSAHLVVCSPGFDLQLSEGRGRGVWGYLCLYIDSSAWAICELFPRQTKRLNENASPHLPVNEKIKIKLMWWLIPVTLRVGCEGRRTASYCIYDPKNFYHSSCDSMWRHHGNTFGISLDTSFPGLHGIHYVEQAGLELGVIFLLLSTGIRPVLSHPFCSRLWVLESWRQFGPAYGTSQSIPCSTASIAVELAFLSLLLIRFHWALADLKCLMEPRLALDSWSPCLYLSSSRIIDVCHLDRLTEQFKQMLLLVCCSDSSSLNKWRAGELAQR